MRRFVLALLIVLAAACNPSEHSTPEVSASHTPAVVTVTGKLSTLFLMPREQCRYVGLPGALAARARDSIEAVEGKTIDFRDSSGNIVGSTTTPLHAEPLGTEERQGRFEVCLAVGDFAVQLPRSDSYAITIRGVPGAPDPVTIEDLKARDFECNLHIHTDGEVLEDDPCEGGGWVDLVDRRLGLG